MYSFESVSDIFNSYVLFLGINDKLYVFSITHWIYLHSLAVYDIRSDAIFVNQLISVKNWHFSYLLLKWKYKARLWTRTKFIYKSWIDTSLKNFCWLQLSLNVFGNKTCLKTRRFMLKTRKWREKIHFKISHFNIVGIWIKLKKNEKTSYVYQGSKELQ